MPTLKLAFDKSYRSFDADGQLHVAKTNISKANVCPYRGDEIPGWDTLGLDPNRIYQLLRDPDELAKAAASFERKQLLRKHIPVNAQDIQPDAIVGCIGSNVEFKTPYLVADICIWDAKAIAGIESEQIVELSCSYRYVPVMQSGSYEGVPYDGRMTEIVANHLSLVPEGRAGHDVLVADHNPFFNKESAMKLSKLGTALYASLCAISPVLAADSALPAMLEKATKKTFDKKGTLDKLVAIDGKLDVKHVAVVFDAMTDLESEPMPQEAKDEDEEEKMEKEAKAKKAMDKDEEDEEKDKKAMDAQIKLATDSLRQEFREANAALADVRPVVGEVLGMDSAAAIYGFALDHLKVEREGVTGVPALKALFKVASRQVPTVSSPKIASDAVGMASRFPNANRFKSI